MAKKNEITSKKEKYLKDIKAQVKAKYNGKIPEHLNLTISQYAEALDMKDYYTEQMKKTGAIIKDKGSTGAVVTKQNPLLTTIYQQTLICYKYATALGLMSVTTDDVEPNKDKRDTMDDFLDATRG